MRLFLIRVAITAVLFLIVVMVIGFVVSRVLLALFEATGMA